MGGPSSEHEVLVKMIRARPEILAARIGRQLGVAPVATVKELPATFSTPPSEYRADVAFEWRYDAGKRLIVVLEVQLTVEEQKKSAWPAYEATARSRHGAPACVVVFTGSRAVARWAERPVLLGPSGSVFRAIVLGPSAMPRRIARSASAELAVLAALSHGHDGERGVRLVRAALRSLESLAETHPETARLYFDFLAFKMKGAVRRAMETMMPPEQEYLSDWFREAHAKGRAEGELSGRLAQARHTLRTVCSARGLELDRATEARLEACTDLETLERWTARAATATTTAEIFEPR
jgi:hypothetical protein